MLNKKQRPEWLKDFSLGKYDDAKRLIPIEWADQIEFRRHIERLLRAQKRDDGQLLNADEQLGLLFNQLLESPLSHHGYSVKSPGDVRQAAQRTVFAVSVFDLRNLLSEIECMGGAQMGQGEGLMPDIEKLSVDSYFTDSEVTLLADYAHVNVDLTGTNDEIKKDFAAWLEDVREARDTANAPIPSLLISKKKRDGWCKDALLPYKDIELLALWTGNTIINEQHIELIRKDDEAFDMSSTIGRTRDRSRALFSRRMVQALTYHVDRVM